jgi:tyrocidine synthetase-3
LYPESTAYNVSGILVLDIDPTMEPVRQRVEETFKRLIRRHESLRTSFHIVGGEPVQRIRDDVEFKIRVYNPGENIDAFDLSCAPLMQVGLMKTGKGTDVIIVNVHHIITDAVSQQMLVRNFSSLYDGKELTPLELQYKDYCAWLTMCREQGDGETAFRHREEFWLKEFSGEVPRLDLPTDFPRPLRPVFEGAVLQFDLDKRETNALKQLAAENGATLFMVLLTIYYILLAKLGGGEDIVIGTPVSGRSHPDFEQVMGVFVNTLALRNFPAEDKSFTNFLKEVKKKTLEAFENQDYPFEELVERLGVGEMVNRGSLFDCMFSLHELNETGGNEDYRAVADDESFHFEQPTSKFDITLTAAVKGERLFFLFRYSTALFKREKIERFAGYFKKVISEVIVKPGEKIGDISLISQEEKEALYSRLSVSLRV